MSHGCTLNITTIIMYPSLIELFQIGNRKEHELHRVQLVKFIPVCPSMLIMKSSNTGMRMAGLTS